MESELETIRGDLGLNLSLRKYRQQDVILKEIKARHPKQEGVLSDSERILKKSTILREREVWEVKKADQLVKGLPVERKYSIVAESEGHAFWTA